MFFLNSVFLFQKIGAESNLYQKIWNFTEGPALNVRFDDRAGLKIWLVSLELFQFSFCNPTTPLQSGITQGPCGQLQFLSQVSNPVVVPALLEGEWRKSIMNQRSYDFFIIDFFFKTDEDKIGVKEKYLIFFLIRKISQKSWRKMFFFF